MVANTKKTNNKKIRSVIDDDENDEFTFELRLIAIGHIIFVLADSRYP